MPYSSRDRSRRGERRRKHPKRHELTSTLQQFGSPAIRVLLCDRCSAGTRNLNPILMRKGQHQSVRSRKPLAQSNEIRGPETDSTGDQELQGRAGEPLPIQESVITEAAREWDTESNILQKSKAGRGKESTRTGWVMHEIEYERGPGSRFQVKGRDGGARRGWAGGQPQERSRRLRRRRSAAPKPRKSRS
jgi:hypothetical protein